MADEAVTDLRLAERRRKKGVALEQISEATKIGMRALRAIEAGEFQKLPGGVYSTSYIRQYAEAIGVDEAQILAIYHSVMGVRLEPEDQSAPATEAPRSLVSRFLRRTSTVFGF